VQARKCAAPAGAATEAPVGAAAGATALVGREQRQEQLGRSSSRRNSISRKIKSEAKNLKQRMNKRKSAN
jgi:hypothetical protein